MIVPRMREITENPNQIHMITEYEMNSCSINVFHASGKKEPAPQSPLAIPIRKPIFDG